MRAYILTGTRSRSAVRPFGSAQRIGAVDLAAITAALSFIGNAFSAVTGAVQNALNFFHIGPGYTAANGGEVRRQLEGLGDLNKPYANPYMHYLQQYAPDVWNSGDIWNAPGYAQRSRFKDAYETLLAAGLPPGALVDRDMVPVGLGAAVAAAEAAQNVTNPTGGTPAPNAQQLEALQVLALQISGFQGAAVAQQAAATVAQLPASWQAFVQSLAAVWQQPTPQPPAPPQTAGMDSNALAVAAGVGLLVLAVNN